MLKFTNIKRLCDLKKFISVVNNLRKIEVLENNEIMDLRYIQ